MSLRRQLQYFFALTVPNHETSKTHTYFDTKTRCLSAETASVSDVIPTTTILLHGLRCLKPPRLLTLRNALLSSMESWCKVFEESTECLLATILDPRYKADYFTTSSAKAQAEQLLTHAINPNPQPSTEDTTDAVGNMMQMICGRVSGV